MKKITMYFAVFASMMTLSQCSQNNQEPETNSIMRCQSECRQRGKLIDYDQTQLQGTCVCDWEKDQ
jgi:regulator of extracellular matrix RemA (YlzA/DUF370 family)